VFPADDDVAGQAPEWQPELNQHANTGDHESEDDEELAHGTSTTPCP
jgi:hypothetical protein